jgi:hypothetical protein
LAVYYTDLIYGSKEVSDKLFDNSIQDPTWQSWINRGMQALDRKLVMAFGDLWITSTTIAFPSTGLLPNPTDFGQFKGLDQQFGERWREVRRFNFQNRNRNPQSRDVFYRVVGNQIMLEPPQSGTFRLWYIPKAVPFKGTKTARLATAGTLACTNTGTGPAAFLGATGHGAIVVDGVTPSVGDTILVMNATIAGVHAPEHDGLYTVTTVGDVSTNFKLTRLVGSDTNATNLYREQIAVTEGTVNTGKIFQLLSSTINLDVSPMVYDLASLDPRLEPYREFLELYAGIKAAVAKEDTNVADLKQQLLDLSAEIETYASETDSGEPNQIADVDQDDNRPWWDY